MGVYMEAGLKGLAFWGVVGAAVVGAMHLAFPAFRPHWRLKGMLITMAATFGCAVKAEKAATLCARYPPWVLRAIDEEEQKKARGRAAMQKQLEQRVQEKQ